MKNYILDTNVLLHDPNSLLNFQDNAVIIPIEVLEEIDRFKRESSELGQNARTVSRMLDAFRAQGRLSEGVRLPNGGTLQIAFIDGKQPDTTVFGNNTVDSRIVALALRHSRIITRKPDPTVLVTKDINLRLKADALGLEAEDFETDGVFLKDLYSGMCEKMVPQDKMTTFAPTANLRFQTARRLSQCVLHPDR